MIIAGERPPCPTYKGVMNQTAENTGATIIYTWVLLNGRLEDE
jgi:hypothetical protein